MLQIREKAVAWSNNLLYVIAFTMPLVPKFQLALLVALLLLFILEKQKGQTGMRHAGSLTAGLLMLFYLYHIAGLLWTENYKAAALDLQIKLPLLIFPLVIYYGRLISEDVRQKIYTFFIYGLEAAVFLCLIRACFFYFYDGSNHFLYKEFSFFVHPGYFSMYLCMGSVLALQRLFVAENPADFKVRMLWFRLVLFTFAIVLLSSKAGIFVQILFLLTSVVLSGVYFTDYRKWNALIPASLAGLLIYFGLFYATTSGRMNEMQDTISKPAVAEVHSSAMRLQAWQTAAQLLVEYPLLGTGTGDSKNVMVEKYLENGFLESYVQKLNAHNQYLQTGITLGIPAMLLLSLLFLHGIYRGATARNWILMAFLVITGLNFMVESMLEVSAGAQFFGLFYVLFSSMHRN